MTMREMATVAALGLGIALAGSPHQAKASIPEDYLVQQVCDDGFGGHTSQDPRLCPGSARKLRIGETLPYHKWDGPQSSLAQISDSFPVGDINGRTRVVHTFFFTRYSYVPLFDGAAALTQNASYDTAAETGMTGYDISMTDGSYLTFMGTYDGGWGWQPFWTNSSCALGDGWVLVPKSLTTPFGQGNSITSFQNTSPQCPSVSNFHATLTVWNNYSNTTYESGAVLDTISSWHFDEDKLDTTGFERFYFTREYGKTRWEAWRASTNYPTPSSIALGRCPTGTGSGYVTFGSTTYTLQDCHDWSFIYPTTGGDWDPAANWHLDPLYNSINLLQNTHLQCTSGGSAAQCAPSGGPGVCQTLVPWNALGSVSLSFDDVLMGREPTAGNPPRKTANCAIRAVTSAAPNGQSIYQDVFSFPGGYSNYTFGTAIWRPVTSNVNATQQAVITVFEVNSSGSIVAQHNLPVSVTRKRQIIKGSFTKSPSTAWIRFQIYFNTPNLDYEFSDAWVAPAV